MDAGGLLSRSDLRKVITFGVGLLGDLKHLSGAETDADATLFAALRENVHLSMRNRLTIQIQRGAGVHLHDCLPVSIPRLILVLNDKKCPYPDNGRGC
jgi:hypothetical protein